MPFTIKEFVAYLTLVAAEMPKTLERANEAAAKIAQAESKREIGQYQEAIGPFSAWPELSDRTKSIRVEYGFTENDPLLRTGALRNAIDMGFDEHHARIGVASEIVGSGSPGDHLRDIAMVATEMELGNPSENIPARPFLGPSIFRESEEMAKAIWMTVINGIVGL